MAKNSIMELEQDINLSHFTFENLHEAVFWVNSKGNILYANDAACKMSGYSKAELVSMLVTHINPSEQVVDFKKFWKQLKAKKHFTFESKHKHKTGYLYDVEITGNFIEIDGQEYTCSIARDIRKRKLEEELLLTISEATSGLVGQDFFNELTRYVTLALGVKTCIVTECTDFLKTCVRTLAYTTGGKLNENIEYDVAGTPCKLVMEGKGNNIFIASGCDKVYPKEAGYDSYVAVPITSPANGDVIGHIAALDDKPMSNEMNQTSILKIFAARAGAEIDRIKAEEKLKVANAELETLLAESEERFRDLFEEAPIAYVHEGLDSKFIKVNRAAMKTLGIRADQIEGTYGSSFIPDTPDAQRRLKEAFDSIGRGVDTSGVVLELRRKDNGQPIWIQWWSNPDVGGQFTRTMFIDITDKVLMEQEQAKLKAENKYLQEEIKLNNNFEEIVSKSKNFHKILQQIEQVASTDATVLITGESGTGKELLARAIHNISNRSKRPLIKINCANLPANLIESELFGHERGAFTGAMERKIGRFELADNGTLFLDEIGELPVELQAKLLRVLQEGEFERLGNPKTLKVNVRVIAATNRNLEEAIAKKEFREDLFYRLNVFPVISPPLRDRKEDIPLLVKHFVKKYEGKMGKEITNVPAKVIDALMLYDWPGNIRELENLIERGLILSRGNTLEYGSWVPSVKISSNDSAGKPIPQKLDDIEKKHIITILEKTNWKVSGEKGAAKILGLNATTLEARMKKLGIERKK
jgi:formate hydrogenlyase transcriptional activator